ncbi:DUF7681 family protein [Methylorubrum populi]|uniref:Acb2/Tad1 hairpin domain-containing protein n=1 Tax=Methylorubrum populi TaxID=223967 RepID=A0A833MYG7_9HYPH|nr:cyclic nucleotide-binding protein [Methylorubrum populi]KAB7782428.1 hypothetical protein F8B43_5183 [Methylorubrum populi]
MSNQQHQGLPVAGYKPQSDEKVALVNENKELEERILRQMDRLAALPAGTVDPRWFSIGRTAIENGFMALNRSIFQPGRASLPEDLPAHRAHDDLGRVA